MFRIIRDDENLIHEIIQVDENVFEVKSECFRIDKYQKVIGKTEAYFGPFETKELAMSSLELVCRSYKILE